MPQDPDDAEGRRDPSPEDVGRYLGPDHGAAPDGNSQDRNGQDAATASSAAPLPRRGRRRGTSGLSAAIPEGRDPDDQPDVELDEAAARSESPPSPSRRHPRDFLADVRDELAEYRRELREMSGNTAEALGLVSEALPQVHELTRTVDTLAGRVDYLLERVDQRPGSDPDDAPAATAAHDVDDDAPEAPGASDQPDGDDNDVAAGRRPRLAERHVPARIARDHGLIGPVNRGCWPMLNVDDAAEQWEALAEFVARLLHPYYQLTRGQLPDCWPAHPRCVVELSWLHRMYQGAANEQAPPSSMAEWHTRWLLAALDTLTSATTSCRPGHHEDPTTAPPGRDSDSSASASSATTSAAPRSATLGAMATRAPVPNAHTPRPDPAYLTADPRAGGVTGHPGEHPAWQPDPRDRRAGGPPSTPDTPSADQSDLAAGELSGPAFWLPHYRRAAAADLEHRAGIADHARHEPENREFAVTRADPAAP